MVRLVKLGDVTRDVMDLPNHARSCFIQWNAHGQVPLSLVLSFVKSFPWSLMLSISRVKKAKRRPAEAAHRCVKWLKKLQPGGYSTEYIAQGLDQRSYAGRKSDNDLFHLIQARQEKHAHCLPSTNNISCIPATPTPDSQSDPFTNKIHLGHTNQLCQPEAGSKLHRQAQELLGTPFTAQTTSCRTIFAVLRQRSFRICQPQVSHPHQDSHCGCHSLQPTLPDITQTT